MRDREFQGDNSRQLEIGGKGIFLLIILISMLVLFLQIKSNAKELYYTNHALQTEGEYYKRTGMVYFKNNNGTDYSINVIAQHLAEKGEYLTVYYMPGRETKAVVMTSMRWNICVYMLFIPLLIFGMCGYWKNRMEK